MIANDKEGREKGCRMSERSEANRKKTTAMLPAINDSHAGGAASTNVDVADNHDDDDLQRRK